MEPEFSVALENASKVEIRNAMKEHDKLLKTVASLKKGDAERVEIRTEL